MPELEEVIEQAFDAMYLLREFGKYKILPGFFQEYTKPVQQSDPEGKRFCNLKLYLKDPDSNDVSILGVPLAYFGSKKGMVDFELEKGDELLVLFSDRSLGPWKEESGVEPQLVTDPVRDSENHAIAIPIVTTHYAGDITDGNPVDSNAIGLRVKPGKKVEIGDGTNELLDLFNQALTEIITLVGNTVLGGANTVDLAGSSSTGTLGQIVVPLSTLETNLQSIQTALANIKV